MGKYTNYIADVAWGKIEEGHSEHVAVAKSKSSEWSWTPGMICLESISQKLGSELFARHKENSMKATAFMAKFLYRGLPTRVSLSYKSESDKLSIDTGRNVPVYVPIWEDYIDSGWSSSSFNHFEPNDWVEEALQINIILLALALADQADDPSDHYYREEVVNMHDGTLVSLRGYSGKDLHWLKIATATEILSDADERYSVAQEFEPGPGQEAWFGLPA